MKNNFYNKNLKEQIEIAKGLTDQEKDELINRKSRHEIPVKDVIVGLLLLVEKSNNDKDTDVDDWECDVAQFLFKY